MYNFKLKIYKDNGSLDHEEFFRSREELETRYDELFVYEKFGLNPTAWEEINGKWRRLEGF